MDQEVAKTLGELELKLQELERELTSIGRRDERQPRTPDRLVDETQEQHVEGGEPFGSPPVFGGEEIPAAPQGATIERDWTVDVRETAYGEIPKPSAPPLPDPLPTPGATFPAELAQVDRAELVRFKEKLERTLRELIDECSRLLSPQPPA